jgi:Zn-dependent protease with chaperone function
VTAPLDLAVESLVHGLVTAVTIEVLIRRVPIETPGDRFGYRLATLVLPLALPPLFLWLAPWRASDTFADLALLSVRRWDEIRLGGMRVHVLALSTLGVAGVWLLAHDLWSSARHWWHDRRASRVHQAPADIPPIVGRAIAQLSTRSGLPPPPVVLLDGPAAVLHCRGLREPWIYLSRPVVDRLSDDELTGAIAHELSHVARRDVARTWILTALRVLHWFNPVAQLVARQAAQEIEWRADADAAAAIGRPVALARALLSCVRGRDTEFLGLLGRGRVAALERRCRRLLAGVPAHAGLGRPVDLLLTGAAIGTLLFFVV